MYMHIHQFWFVHVFICIGSSAVVKSVEDEIMRAALVEIAEVQKQYARNEPCAGSVSCVCGSELQWVAVSCGELRWVAVSCSELRWVALCRSSGTAVCGQRAVHLIGKLCEVVCGGLVQCVAVWCSAFQNVAVSCSELQWVAVSCSELQWVAVSCSELQWVAVSCSELQW